ncbi:MAG: hypothetical protein IT370_02950 [Deltaproteobacteria bacterium]|nr:hypothetical protein [Deltaproteobacteria bacterium]
MRRHRLLTLSLLALAAVPALAHADEPGPDPAPGAVEVTRTRRPNKLVLDVFVGGGLRRVDDAAGTENTTGIAFGALLGRRLGGRFAGVALLGVDILSRQDYFSYGTWNFGGALRYEGPVTLNVGGGLSLGTAKTLVGYTLQSASFVGPFVFAHATLPLLPIGRGSFGITGDVAVRSMEGDTRILSTTVGAALSW